MIEWEGILSIENSRNGKLFIRKEETANWPEGNQQSLITRSKERVYNLKVEKPDVRKVRTDWRKVVELNVVNGIH